MGAHAHYAGELVDGARACSPCSARRHRAVTSTATSLFRAEAIRFSPRCGPGTSSRHRRRHQVGSTSRAMAFGRAGHRQRPGRGDPPPPTARRGVRALGTVVPKGSAGRLVLPALSGRRPSSPPPEPRPSSRRRRVILTPPAQSSSSARSWAPRHARGRHLPLTAGSSRTRPRAAATPARRDPPARAQRGRALAVALFARRSRASARRRTSWCRRRPAGRWG
jgi:hypothetical protein